MCLRSSFTFLLTYLLTYLFSYLVVMIRCTDGDEVKLNIQSTQHSAVVLIVSLHLTTGQVVHTRDAVTNQYSLVLVQIGQLGNIRLLKRLKVRSVIHEFLFNRFLTRILTCSPVSIPIYRWLIFSTVYNLSHLFYHVISVVFLSQLSHHVFPSVADGRSV